MSILKKVSRFALAFIFILSLIPIPLFSFAQVAQADGDWMKYSGDFTFTTGNPAYIIDSHVIKDGATYKMWYTYFKSDLSISDIGGQINGVDSFGTFITALEGLDVDGMVAALGGMTTDELNTLLDIFDGFATAIGYATSSDGKNWEVVNSNSLTGSGTLWGSVGFPTVINNGDGTYKMWYTRIDKGAALTRDYFKNTIIPGLAGSDASRQAQIEYLLNSFKTVIGYATSTDGSTWTVQNNSALEITGVSAWDAQDSVFAPTVVKESDTSYKMWFSRVLSTYTPGELGALLTKISGDTAHINDFTDITGKTTTVIGYATSADGSAWTVSPTTPIVVANGTSLSDSVMMPAVIKTGTNYEMWFSATSSSLGDAGLHTLINNIVDINITTLWNSLKTNSFSDFLDDLAAVSLADVKNTLTGSTAVISYATSSDGTTWTLQNATELTGGTPAGLWNSVASPSVVKDTMSEMWFTKGFDDLTFSEAIDWVDGTTIPLGYASSKMLVNLAVTPASQSLAIGQTVQLTANGTYNDATTENLTASTGTTWTSSDDSKATVAGGLVTAVSTGTVVITASYGGVSSNAVTINVGPATLNTITVTPADPTVAQGHTVQFTATGLYTDGSTSDITGVVTWSSSNTAVATINAAGLASTPAVGGPVTITASMSGKSGTTTLTVTAAEYDYLEITPGAPAIANGDTLQLTATAVWTNGTTQDVTALATWSLDTANGVATIGATGLATATAAAGTETVRASYNGKDDTVVVTGQAARLTGIAITGAATVAAGQTTAALTATGTYSDGSTADVSATATWASLSTGIATINGTTRVVTGVTQGNATIRATLNGYTDTHVVTVTAPVLTAIAVTPVTPTIPNGTAMTFTATGTYSDGSTGVLTNAADGLTWDSGTPATATIDAATGAITTVGVGTSTITATVGVITGNTVLTVTAATLDSIAITPLTANVPNGKTTAFTATGTYSDASTVDITTMVTWASSNTAVATVNANTGIATAVASTGTSNITCSFVTPAGTVDSDAPAVLTAVAPEVVSIAITPANSTVPKGGTGTQTKTYTATGTYSDGSTDVIDNADLTWSITAVTGTATNVSNVVTGTGLGTVTVKVQHTTPTTATVINAETGLTVVAPVLDSLAITGTNTVAAGGNINDLVVTGTYSDNSTDATLKNQVTWASSNPAVATVDENGILTSFAQGTTNLTASLSGKTSPDFAVTVTAATVSSVSVDPVGAVIAAGNTRNFRAVANYTDGTKVVVTTTAAWASDAGGVATVGAANGVVTGVAVGTANISATFDGKTGTVSVKITNATLTSIDVTPDLATVAAGNPVQLTATGTYSDASTADITKMVVWSSASPAVVTVNQVGLATGQVIGSSNITATLGAVSGSEIVSVTAAVLSSIVVTPVDPTVTFVSGAAPTVQFTATGVNSDGSTTDMTTSVTWSSDAGGVATIAAGTGLATTVGAGTATITADDGAGHTDTTDLTVLADTVAPVATITAPIDGVITSNQNVTVTGNINDINAATKQLVINGTTTINLTLDGSGNFSQGVVLNAGNNTLTVKAVDGAGNTGNSKTIVVKVKPNAPVITLNSPVDGTLTNSTSVTVSGSATNTAEVSVIVNGVSSTVAVTGGVFSTTANLSSGTNIITVRAYTTGFDGQADYMGTSGTRTVEVDITAPVVTINAPINNSVVSVANQTISGTIDDTAVTTANLILNGGIPVAVPVNNGKFNYVVTLVNGANTISVRATDEAGNTSSSATLATVTLDTTKPAVVLTSPVNNLRTNANSQTIAGTVSDPRIETVTLNLNGTTETIPVTPNIGTGKGEFSVVKTLRNGVNTIEVTATNGAVPPTTGTSGVIRVTVDTTAPTLTVGLSDPTDTVTITLYSNEALKAAPTVEVNSTPVTMTTTGQNKWSGTYTIPADGIYEVYCSGTDLAGNKTIHRTSFTRETVAVSGTAATQVRSNDVVLSVETNGAANGRMSVLTHFHNPSGNVGNPSGANAPAGMYLEIQAGPDILNNLSGIYVESNYDPDTLPAGTDESSLRMYLWDVETGTWQLVGGSGVDTTRRVNFATLPHLSQYGTFGSTTVTGGGGAVVTTPEAGVTSVIYKIDSNGKFVVQATALSDDSLAEITIPKDTIGRTVDGNPVTEISMVSMATQPTMPAELSAVGLVYEFGPDGATFDPGITVTVTYTDDDIPAGKSESDLVIAYQDDSGAWVNLPSTVDTVNNTVTAQTTHFTPYAVVLPLASASFTVSNLVINPAEVEINETATISVDVTNDGDVSGDYTVELKLDGTIVDSETVTVAGGETEQVTFSVAKAVAGEYTLAVGTTSGVLTVVAAEEPLTPAAFTSSNLRVSPATIETGDSATITVTVENTGGESGTYELALKVDGAVAATKTVVLNGGESQDVTFSIIKQQAGTYSISIDSLSGTLTVEAPETTTPTTTPIDETEPSGLAWWVWLLIGIAVVAVVFIVVILMRKNRTY